jgi:glucosylceramidase
VCVCNATYCDTLNIDYPKTNDDVFILSSSENGLRFEENRGSFEEDARLNISDGHQVSFATSLNQRLQQYLNPKNVIVIDRNKTFQKIIGFGNALTGAVSHNLKLVASLQHQIFKSYFSKSEGIGLNIIRTPIGGCDFDLEPWAYNELPENDKFLSNFTKLDWRDEEKVAHLNDLMEVSGNSDIKIVGSAWSPPRWMKTNNAWTGFSALKDEFYQTWAEYHLKYLELMQENGIDFWAITTGNEPLNGFAAFPFIAFMSLGWIPHTQAKWVNDNLGPTIKDSKSTAHVKIIAGDDQRYTFPWWFDRMYQAYPESRNFIDGHGVHWYWDKYVSAYQLEKTHDKYSDKMIIATEACSGDKPWEEHKPMLGYWPRGEDYIIDIMEDLNHYVNAWIDWNMILDENGGEISGFCGSFKNFPKLSLQVQTML